jgi:hypothetical protein
LVNVADTFSHNEHILFIHKSINYSLMEHDKKQIESAFDWENELARAEVKRK